MQFLKIKYIISVSNLQKYFLELSILQYALA